MFEEEPKIVSVQEYWRIVCRRRWWIFLTIFVCWVIAWTTAWLMPARYRSEALILVEQQVVPEHYVLSNVTVDLHERLQSMTQQVLSRTRLENIIQQFGLYKELRGRLSVDQLVDRMREDINIELVQSQGTKNELTAFRVYYSGRNAATAQQVARQLTSLFIDENLTAQQQQSESTTAFFAGELERAREHLGSQEAKIRQFKAQYLGQLPSQLESNVQILTGLQSRQQALMQALNHSQQQKIYLESLLSQYRSVNFSPDSGDTMPAVEKEIARLKTEIANAQSLYTPTHPDVIHLKSQLAQTEKLKKELDSRNPPNNVNFEKGKTVVPPLTASSLQVMTPIMQIESQLEANSREIKDSQAEIEKIEKAIVDYQSRLNFTPLREQQLADLMRDYEQSKANYDSLLGKQMQSQLATNLEMRQQGQQFRILDPPNLPAKPFSPNRMTYSLLGLAAGVVIALVVTVIVETRDLRIRSAGDLEGLVDARVLVRVPHLNIPGDQRKRTAKLSLEWGSALLLLLVFSVANLFTFLRG